MGKKFFIERQVVDITEEFNARGVDVEECVMTLSHVRDLGYENPFLHGGFLRDRFLRVPTRDFDVFTRSHVEPDDSPQRKDRPRRIFMLDGLEVDIIQKPKYQSAADAAKCAAVPLCSPSLGLDGRVWAHRDFLEAAEGHIYAPDLIPDAHQLKRMLVYFDRLRQKIPGLILKMPPLADKVIERLEDKSLLNLFMPARG